MSVRVLVADDHKIVRDGLCILLSRTQDMELVGEAADGWTAVKLAVELSPDVVVMDISMPELNGVEATRRILEDSPGTRVIALSMHSDRTFVSRALRAGASGYLVKDCAFDELVRAIQATVAGRVYLSPSIAHIVLEDYISDGAKAHTSTLAVLSAREREVMQLLAEGKTTRQAARCLYLSPKTIETHRANIMKKLDLCGLADLVRYAIREGLAALEV